jgi:hypothetical protein
VSRFEKTNLTPILTYINQFIEAEIITAINMATTELKAYIKEYAEITGGEND